MDAIEKMIQRMNEQARQERDLLKKETLAKIDQMFDHEHQQLEKEKKAQLAQQTQRIEKKYKQQRDRQQVTYRQTALHEKQKVLTQFFEAATKEMTHWPMKEIQLFCEQLLAQVKLEKEFVIEVGELSRESLTSQWIEEMNEKFPMTLHVAETSIPKQAGFILHDAGIQYNFIFENLVKDVQETMGFELAKNLFK